MRARARAYSLKPNERTSKRASGANMRIGAFATRARRLKLSAGWPRLVCKQRRRALASERERARNWATTFA